MLTVNSIRWAIEQLTASMDRAAPGLNALDGALGDGDLGVTLSRAFQKLMEMRQNLPEDLGGALLKCSQAFTGVDASTYGTLLATGLMSAAKVSRGREALPWTEISPLLAVALKAMSDRGKGSLGDKTVLDVIEAAARATEGLAEPHLLVEATLKQVDETIAAFRGRPFRQGRARIFGDRGLERDDPGMVAFQRMVQSLHAAPLG
jgi:dihydroxyacetone kinase-like protein